MDLNNQVLYLPISYYAGSPTTSVSANVSLTFNIGNGLGTFREATMSATTRTREYPNHVKVSMKEWYYNGYKQS